MGRCKLWVCWQKRVHALFLQRDPQLSVLALVSQRLSTSLHWQGSNGLHQCFQNCEQTPPVVSEAETGTCFAYLDIIMGLGDKWKVNWYFWILTWTSTTGGEALMEKAWEAPGVHGSYLDVAIYNNRIQFIFFQKCFQEKSDALEASSPLDVGKDLLHTWCACTTEWYKRQIVTDLGFRDDVFVI